MTNTLSSKLQVTAILLMAVGWGWSGGNFTPSDAPIWNYLVHCIPLLLLIALSLQFFRGPAAHQSGKSRINGAINAISIFAIVSIIGASMMIVLGATNPDPNSVGVHNFADWFPTIILNMGTLLWLVTLILASRRNAQASIASNA